ncbi:hypothetical protein LTR84_005791 [Exophiala bonariae]|uniref:Major facilitator superfamily (MFS) profile domain-containing protein n=1 Tax=Exophiala bonariae TaxID=1690606 RepID=A0AAV9N4J3_9EURO|nr:hypothetical protein LTR84_005791 [Exophiala bonariae]
MQATSHLPGEAGEDIPPEGGLYAWLVVAGCFALLMASWGLLFSVGIFQTYFEANQLRDFSPSEIGWIPGVLVFVALTVGLQVGPLLDRYGPTYILLLGTICIASSFLVLAQCNAYWQIMLCFGFWAGLGCACLSTPAIAIIPHYFQRRVGFALGVALAGAGLGGVVFPFMIQTGFDHIGWAWTMRMLALIFGVLAALGTASVKSRLAKKMVKGVLSFRSFKDSRFTWLVVGLFCKRMTFQNCIAFVAKRLLLVLEFDFYAVLGILPTFTIAKGFSTSDSTSMMAVLNA